MTTESDDAPLVTASTSGDEPMTTTESDDAPDEQFDAFLSFLETPSAPSAGTPPEETERDAAETRPEAAGDDSSSPAIVYTDEELAAMRSVRAQLVEEHGIEESRVGAAFLAVATINCKLRVDETVGKIKKLLEIMAKLGCPDGIDDELWKPEAKHELHPYPPTGRDKRGCRITWIQGGGRVKKEEERAHCHACIMQYLSQHADANTLRNGVTFVVNLTGKEDMATAPKQGNEKLMQSFYQAIPQRPQIIMIAGCNVLMRTFVNATIKLASLFVKQKILQRIHFVTQAQAAAWLPEESAPVLVGGKGGGIEDYEEWVRERLEGLPAPAL